MLEKSPSIGQRLTHAAQNVVKALVEWVTVTPEDVNVAKRREEIQKLLDHKAPPLP